MICPQENMKQACVMSHNIHASQLPKNHTFSILLARWKDETEIAVFINIWCCICRCADRIQPVDRCTLSASSSPHKCWGIRARTEQPLDCDLSGRFLVLLAASGIPSMADLGPAAAYHVNPWAAQERGREWPWRTCPWLLDILKEVHRKRFYISWL